jgi:hypothetical protein
MLTLVQKDISYVRRVLETPTQISWSSDCESNTITTSILIVKLLFIHCLVLESFDLGMTSMTAGLTSLSISTKYIFPITIRLTSLVNPDMTRTSCSLQIVRQGRRCHSCTRRHGTHP